MSGSKRKRLGLVRKGLAIKTAKKTGLSLNPDDSDNVSLLLYPGDYEGSPGYKFLEWQCYAVVQSVRFQASLNIPDLNDKTEPAYIGTGIEEMDLFREFESHALRMDTFVKEAKEIGLIDDHFHKAIQKSRGNFKLINIPYHEGDETAFSYGLKFFNAIAIIAIQGVKNYLRDGIVPDGNLFEMWMNLTYYAPESCRKMNKTMARKVLGFMHYWWDIYTYQDKLLREIVTRVSLKTSPLTNFPLEDSPLVSSTAELSSHYDTRVRLISAFHRQRLLGQASNFGYNPMVRDSLKDSGRVFHSRFVDFEDLYETLSTAWEVTHKYKWRNALETLVNIDELDPALKRIWQGRYEDYKQLKKLLQIVADQIHSVGYMDYKSTAGVETQEFMLGKFLHLTEEISVWSVNEVEWEWINNTIGEDIEEEEEPEDDDFEKPEVKEVDREILATHLEKTFNPDSLGVMIEHVCEFLGRKQEQNHGKLLRKMIHESHPNDRRKKGSKVDQNRNRVWLKFVSLFDTQYKTKRGGVAVLKSGIKAVCSAHKIASWLLDYFPQESLDKIESLKRSGKLNAELPPRPPSMVQVSDVSEIT